MFELITDKTKAEYESFVESHPKGHFMQSHTWAGCKSAWKWEAVAVRNPEGKIVGGMSVLIRKAPGLPYSLMYAGRGPVCDVHDRAVLSDLLEGAKALAKQYRAYLLKADPDIPMSDTGAAENFFSLGFRRKETSKNFEGIQPRFVFRLDVKGKTAEEVFESFESKTRYNVRLSARKGVEVRICGDEMVDTFAEIMKTTGERDSFIVRGADYFRTMLHSLGDHARLYMAFYNDKPVAGTLAIAYGNKVWYLYGASANEYRNVMPNYALQWAMIQWSVELGCDIYDFRGVSGDLSEDNPLYGLYRFKKGFNGEFTEFAGEFDYAFKPLVAVLLEKGQHLYRHGRKKVRDLLKGRKK